MAAAKRRFVDALIGGENHQVSVRGSAARSEAQIHSVWREKVIKWYFAIVSALDRQHQADEKSPFSRSSVHVTTALLDSYLLSLPSELSRRYKHDRAAYQVLATSCLLLGLRLTQHDLLKNQALVRPETSSANVHPTCQLKRAKTHRDHMDQANHEEGEVVGVYCGAASHPTEEPHAAATTVAVIPTAATILQMSAAPKTMSESKIMTMVREIIGSSAFPNSHVVTALDFIRALSTSTNATQYRAGSDVTITPEVEEEACSLVDISLRDVNLIGCRPSVVASAAITLALFRSQHGSHDLSSLRQDVCATIFGADADPVFQVVVKNAEAKILAAAHVPIPRQQVNPMRHYTTHLIPLEDE